MSRAGCGHRGHRIAQLAIVLAFAFGVPAIAGAQAQARGESGWGYALANELMSPWCPGFALPDCSSGYASDLRLWILEQERLGRSEDDVKKEILARYGEKILQAPSAEGRGILAYAIPAALIAVGLAVLVTFLRRQGAPANGSGGSAASLAALGATPDAELLSRVDAEIARFDRTHD